MSDYLDLQRFQEDVAKEVQAFQRRLPAWFEAGPYADHLRPLDPLDRRERERLERISRWERLERHQRTRERVAPSG